MPSAISQQGMTKKQTHAAFQLMQAFTAKWTSHRQSCERLKSEMAGALELAECTCGYFDAWKALEAELSRIRKGEPRLSPGSQSQWKFLSAGLTR